MAAINIEDVDPLRRNLVVICLIILIYVIGGGSLDLVDGTTARLGLVGVTLERPEVLKVAALFVFGWSWYRYQVFGKKASWDDVYERASRLLISPIGKVSLERAANKEFKRYVPVDVETGKLKLQWGGGLLTPLWRPWLITNVSIRERGGQKFIERANRISLGWGFLPFKLRLIFRSMYSTQYIVSVVLPNLLVLTTLVAVLIPSFALLYSEIGVTPTVAGTALVLVLLERKWLFDRVVAAWTRNKDTPAA